MNPGPKILVAGIGNIFLGDDGFGVEVARRLLDEPLARQEGVRVLDVGIRSLHLAYELLDGYDALVLVDAMPLDDAPGSLVVFEPSRTGEAPAGPALDAHSVSPGAVLDMLDSLGGSVRTVRVIGCQPSSLAEGIGLSAPVAAAVDAAVELVSEVIVNLGGVPA